MGLNCRLVDRRSKNLGGTIVEIEYRRYDLTKHLEANDNDGQGVVLVY